MGNAITNYPAWFQRALNTGMTNNIPNADGTFSTMKTMTATTDGGKAILFPTIRQTKEGLVQYKPKDAINIAKVKKDYMRYSTEDEAIKDAKRMSKMVEKRRKRYSQQQKIRKALIDVVAQVNPEGAMTNGGGFSEDPVINNDQPKKDNPTETNKDVPTTNGFTSNVYDLAIKKYKERRNQIDEFGNKYEKAKKEYVKKVPDKEAPAGYWNWGKATPLINSLIGAMQFRYDRNPKGFFSMPSGIRFRPDWLRKALTNDARDDSINTNRRTMRRADVNAAGFDKAADTTKAKAIIASLIDRINNPMGMNGRRYGTNGNNTLKNAQAFQRIKEMNFSILSKQLEAINKTLKTQTKLLNNDEIDDTQKVDILKNISSLKQQKSRIEEEMSGINFEGRSLYPEQEQEPTSMGFGKNLLGSFRGLVDNITGQ